MARMLALMFVAAALAACGDESAQRGARPEASSAPGRASVTAVARDTIHVVAHDTLRTVVHETLRTTRYDTLRTVVLETLRVVVEDTSARDLPQEVAPAAVATEDSVPTYAAQDREQLGRGYVTPATMAALTRNVPMYTTVAASELDSLQRDMLAAVVGASRERIQRFRWGVCLAPEEDEGHGATFLTVWYGEDANTREAALRVSSAGQIIRGAPNPD